MTEARTVAKLIAPLARRVRLTARRAVVRRVDDAARLQSLQVAVYADEVRDRAERFQHYGLTSHPHAGAEAVVLALGGNSDHSVVIAVDDRRYRLTALAAGEVALYDDQGQHVHLLRGRQIVVGGAAQVTVQADTKITLDAPLVHVTGNLTVAGTAAAAGALSSATSVADPTGTMAGMRSTYNSHTHPENGSGGGTTSAPNQPME